MDSAGNIARHETASQPQAGIMAEALLAGQDAAMEGPPEFAPRAVRQRVLIRAAMHVTGLPVQDAIVRNVSERGMCVSTRGEMPRVDETVRLSLPCGLARDGTVRWTEGNVFGIALDEAIDLAFLGIATQRRHAGLGRDLSWRLQGHFRQDEPEEATRLRRCC